MRVRKTRIVAGALIGLYLLPILAGWKTFLIWGQITALIGQSPIDLALGGNLHVLRYTVILPVLIVAKALGMPPDTLFGYAVFASVVGASWLLARSVAMAQGRPPEYWDRYFPIPFGFLALLSLNMNGRIAFAMLGFALLLAGQTAWVARRSSAFQVGWRQVVGLWLMSVSSGTFLVGLLSVGAFSLLAGLRHAPRIPRRDWRLFRLGAGLVLLLLPLGGLFLKKNVDFFGGGMEGFVKMLAHGAGRVMPSADPVSWLLLAGLAACFGLGALRWVRGLKGELRADSAAAPLQIGAMFSVLGGLFGLSTFAAGIPVIVALAQTRALRPQKSSTMPV